MYYRRYYSRYWTRKPSKRDVLSRVLGGIDTDIERIFLNLPEHQVQALLVRYGKLYGEGAGAYAKRTYNSWKLGKTKISGRVAERLVDLVPRYLTPKVRFELVRKLRQAHLAKSSRSLTTTRETWRNDVLPVIQEVVAASTTFQLPHEVFRKATWLADGDAQAAQKLLEAAEIQEAKTRLAYLENEFRRIEQMLTSVQASKKIEHKIELPQGSILIRIVEYQTLWERILNFGGLRNGK